MIWLLATALAADPHTNSADESAGWVAGNLAGQQVDCNEFYAYGAGAGCLNGCIGCAGMAGAAYFIDPHAWDPLRAEAPDARHPETFPSPPGDVQDPDAWRRGYEEGWDQAVQQSRARNALVGGSVPVLIWSAAVGGYVLLIVALATGF